MTSLANLQAAVSAQTTVEASVVTLLQTLSADLQAAIASGNDAAVQSVADQITQNTATLAAAVSANTPAAGGAPAAGSFTVGGTVSGLTAGSSLVLVNNGGDSVTVNANGPFVFPTALASGATYAVTVGTPPSGQAATITNGTGTATANVTNVTVVCV